MRIFSNYPTDASGAQTLRGLDDPNLTTYEVDGITYAVDSAGNTWYNGGDAGWLPDSTYTATMRQVEASVPGAVTQAKSESSSMDSLMNSLSQIVSTVVTAKAQHDLLQTNLDRAKRGLPPLNAQAYMPGVNVGVSDDTKKLIIGLGLGAGALFLLGKMFSHRR